MDHQGTEISARVSEDQDELFNQLVLEHALDLKKIAYLYVNDLAECEDIIQEVFLSCYRNLSTFRNESAYKTWLIRITINKCKDYHRLWRVKSLIYKPISQLKLNQSSTEEVYLQQENTSEIVKQIHLLSPKYKEVLILYYYQEMTMQEISEVLEISINTVKSRLLRGKDALQKKLERV